MIDFPSKDFDNIAKDTTEKIEINLEVDNSLRKLLRKQKASYLK